MHIPVQLYRNLGFVRLCKGFSKNRCFLDQVMHGSTGDIMLCRRLKEHWLMTQGDQATHLRLLLQIQ